MEIKGALTLPKCPHNNVITHTNQTIQCMRCLQMLKRYPWEKEKKKEDGSRKSVESKLEKVNDLLES